MTALFYFAYLTEPTLTANVTAQPQSLGTITALDIQAAGTGIINQGVVQLVISGSINDPLVSQLTLITGAPGSAVPQVQASSYMISHTTFVDTATFAGTAQLGTAQAPITGTSLVPFQLVSGDSHSHTIEAQGNIAVTVESFPGGNRLANYIIIWLGLLATVISLWQWASQHRTPERTSHEQQT